jgi:hypothetical protein
MRRHVAAVWLLLASDLVITAITYARLPAHELYHVSGCGLEGGLSRALVELNFPGALLALAVLLVVAPAVPNRVWALVGLAGALCLVVVVPGIVNTGDLDARPVNAIPAVGVLLALPLSLLACPTAAPRRARGDRVRVVLLALTVLACAPWIAAALGFYLDGVPLLGSLFQTGRMVSFHGNAPHPAVHHGIHHGWQALMLVAAALILSRLAVPRGARAFLALLLAYGAGNIVNDGWLEQVAERGWTDGTFPDVLHPAANWGWLAVLLVAAAIWAAWFRRPAAIVGP